MPVTRITQASLTARTYTNLQASLRRGEALQQQLSSGKQVSRPSDGPGQVAAALQLRNQVRGDEQYIRNGQDAEAWLDTADTALQSVSTALQRVREITVQAANGTNSATQLNAYADEIDQLTGHILAMANTQYLGRPVFGGTIAGGTALDMTPGATYGDYVGNGDTQQVQRRLGPDVEVRVDTDGLAVFGTGATGVIKSLQSLATAMRTTPAAVGGFIGTVDTHLDNVLAGLADVGARTNRVQVLGQVNTDRILTGKQHQSEIEDIDLPGTIIKVQMQQAGYQAALGATARVLQPSLLDFLR
jgi:flagellar hook-associated protein 3 FlgL